MLRKFSNISVFNSKPLWIKYNQSNKLCGGKRCSPILSFSKGGGGKRPCSKDRGWASPRVFFAKTPLSLPLYPAIGLTPEPVYLAFYPKWKIILRRCVAHYTKKINHYIQYWLTILCTTILNGIQTRSEKNITVPTMLSFKNSPNLLGSPRVSKKSWRRVTISCASFSHLP